MLLLASPPVDTQDALSTVIKFYTSDQGTHFTVKDVQHSAHTHVINWFYSHNLITHRRLLRERWNGLLKTNLWHLLGNNTLKDQNLILQDVIYAMNYRPLYGATS